MKRMSLSKNSDTPEITKTLSSLSFFVGKVSSFFKARPYIVSVRRLQFIEGNTVVQDGFDAGLFRNKLGRQVISPQNVSFLSFITSAWKVILLMG